MSQHLHTWSVSGTVKFSTWPFSFHSVLSCMLGTCTLTATGPWRGKRQNDSRLINLREWNEHRCYRPNFTAKSTYITKEVGFLMEKYVYCKNIHRTFHGSKKKTLFLRRNSSSGIRLSSVFIFLLTGSSSWGGGGCGWDGGAGAELGGCGTGGAGTNAVRRSSYFILMWNEVTKVQPPNWHKKFL